MNKLVFGLGCFILGVFTLMGFIIPQECDIDRVYLWCRLHPFSFGDFIGCLMVYAGGLGLVGLPEKLGIRLMGKVGGVGIWPFVFVVGAALGAILIWNT